MELGTREKVMGLWRHTTAHWNTSVMKLLDCPPFEMCVLMVLHLNAGKTLLSFFGFIFTMREPYAGV